MRPNEALYASQSVWSPNGAYRLTMQTDGNLVSYGPGGAIWASRTTGHSGAWAIMQSDGNLVVYSADGQPLWSTGSGGNPGAQLAIQSDGNVVLYYGSAALFASYWHTTVGWQQTSTNVGAAGNCTYWAYQKFHDDSGYWAYFPGNAGDWATTAAQGGWRVQSTPSTHSIVVFPPGVDGASSTYGHVAWVEGVTYNGDGSVSIYISEMNFSGFNQVDHRTVTVDSRLQFITAPEK
jgi:surface antigen